MEVMEVMYAEWNWYRLKLVVVCHLNLGVCVCACIVATLHKCTNKEGNFQMRH